MNIRNLTCQVYQKNFTNYRLFLVVCCYFNLAESKNNDFNNYLNFYCHYCLVISCMFLFLVLFQKVFCTLFCHDLLLFPIKASLLSFKAYLFHHFFFLNYAKHSKNSYLLFEVGFGSYEPALDTLYLSPSKYLYLSPFLYLAVQIYLFILLNFQFALCMNFLPFCKILLGTLILIATLRFYLQPLHLFPLRFCINEIFLFKISLMFHIFASNFSLNQSLLERLFIKVF